MKNVLITGVSGMVGSHLADFLLKKTNWKIYGACRWRSPMDNVDHLLNLANKKNSRIKFVYGDITDSYSMIELIKTSNPDYEQEKDMLQSILQLNDITVEEIPAKEIVPSSEN